MKKWTVMMIPQGEGSTSSHTLTDLHFWSVCGFIVLLSFTTAFFYQRHSEISQRATLLRQANRALELENAAIVVPNPAMESGLSREEAHQMEERLRAEYETSIMAITSELNDLYTMESRAREITGLEPRTAPSFETNGGGNGGRGGGPANVGYFAYAGGDETVHPPFVIYGMARPSADLIIEEIRLRSHSLGELVADMEVEKDRIARVPASWPLSRGVGRISSKFGYRRDPFNKRVRHHDGLDISARKGTTVRATAKGVVREAEYRKYLGNVIVIDHGNGIKTFYAHLSSMEVRPGKAVGRGDAIGRVGSTGRSTGAHLHYEVQVKGRPVDPAKYLTD
ncbi:MAG: M23 family metallopeptidase [Candidatus Hydrogenedentes bacterium]|nr:M23 family metallopeptidase [Candidatus Hydrogenedentota bacterium]